MNYVSIFMSDALVTILLLSNQGLNSKDGYVETSLLKVSIFYCFDKDVPLLALKNLIISISIVDHEGHTSWNNDFGQTPYIEDIESFWILLRVFRARANHP